LTQSFFSQFVFVFYLNGIENKSRMDNQEILAKLGRQDTGQRQTKPKTQHRKLKRWATRNPPKTQHRKQKR
jgi:hypothetical protein